MTFWAFLLGTFFGALATIGLAVLTVPILYRWLVLGRTHARTTRMDR